MHDRVVEPALVLEVAQIHRGEHLARQLVVRRDLDRQPRREASSPPLDLLLIPIELFAPWLGLLRWQRLAKLQVRGVLNPLFQVERPVPLDGRPGELRTLFNLFVPERLPRRLTCQIRLATGILVHPAFDQAAQCVPAVVHGVPALASHRLKMSQVRVAGCVLRRSLRHQDDERIRNQRRLCTGVGHGVRQGVWAMPPHPDVHTGVTAEIRIENAVGSVVLNERRHRGERQLGDEERRHPEVAGRPALANERLDRRYAHREQPRMPGVIPNAEECQRAGHAQVLPDGMVRAA